MENESEWRLKAVCKGGLQVLVPFSGCHYHEIMVSPRGGLFLDPEDPEIIPSAAPSTSTYFVGADVQSAWVCMNRFRAAPIFCFLLA